MDTIEQLQAKCQESESRANEYQKQCEYMRKEFADLKEQLRHGELVIANHKRQANMKKHEALEKAKKAIQIIHAELDAFDEKSTTKIALQVGRIQVLIGDIEV